MFKNYLVVAFRNFWHKKAFTVINVAGLAIGVSAALVIYLIVSYEFSFDTFEKDSDRIYRLVSDFNLDGKDYHSSGVANAIPGAVKNEIAGLEIAAPLRSATDGLKVTINSPGHSQVVFKKQTDFAFADEFYFKLLSYKWLAGSPEHSLKEPYQVVLTESNAKLFFPSLAIVDIPGKVINVNDSIRLTITGIVQDLKENTDFNFKAFISRISLNIHSFKPDDGDEWASTNHESQLWLKLSVNNQPGQIISSVNRLFKKYHQSSADDHNQTSFNLEPLKDLHFNTDYSNFDQRQAHRPTLYGLLAIAIFLLALGCINFINLTTAQSSTRTKEIGVRKTMGGSTSLLLLQFLSETFLLVFISFILSIILAPVILYLFSGFIPSGIHFSTLFKPGASLFIALLLMGVALLSGFYPAIILSSYKPAAVLKNNIQPDGESRSSWLRKSLTVFQFVIAQVLIIATILVSRQIHYSLNKDLGFKKDAILYFHTPYKDDKPGNKFLLLTKLKSIPQVNMVSLSNNPPVALKNNSRILKYNDGKKEIEAEVQVKFGDSNYIKLYRMRLIAGNQLQVGDTVSGLLINETYAHLLGFQQIEEAVGKFLEWQHKRIPIVGVIADFHTRSLHDPMLPVVIGSWASQETNINIALKSQGVDGISWTTAIKQIGKAWKDIYPAADLEYSFLDETIASYYATEQSVSVLLKWATGIAIFISCLGLLGLSMFITNQRTKEIGIRKIVGATAIQLVALLSKDFLELVLIAFFIAVPIAWWGTHKWLAGFAFKTTLNWWIFIAGGLIMLLLSLLTLSVRTIKVAIANPVKSLRVG